MLILICYYSKTKNITYFDTLYETYRATISSGHLAFHILIHEVNFKVKRSSSHNIPYKNDVKFEFLGFSPFSKIPYFSTLDH